MNNYNLLAILVAVSLSATCLKSNFINDSAPWRRAVLAREANAINFNMLLLLLVRRVQPSS